MATGFIPKFIPQTEKMGKNGKVEIIGRSKMQQLRDQLDDGKIDINKLEKMKNTQIKFSGDYYVDKFDKHVNRGAF